MGYQVDAPGEEVYRVMLVGNMGVGKTGIRLRVLHDKFNVEGCGPTPGYGFHKLTQWLPYCMFGPPNSTGSSNTSHLEGNEEYSLNLSVQDMSGNW